MSIKKTITGHPGKALERLEDADDLKELEAMRMRPLKFRRFDAFIQQEKIHVMKF